MTSSHVSLLIDADVEAFIFSLQKETIAKVLRTIELLDCFGNNLGMPHAKKLKDQLFELRIRGKVEVRICYVYYNDTIVLLHGFVKKTQKIPQKELYKALKKAKMLDNI